MIRLERPFYSQEPDALPAEMEGAALRLQVSAKKLDQGELRIALAAGYSLSEKESARFRRLFDAMVIHVAERDGEGVWSTALVDPGVEPLERSENYTGNPSGWGSETIRGSAWLNCTLVVAMPAPRPLYLHLSMLGRTSACVELAPDAH